MEKGETSGRPAWLAEEESAPSAAARPAPEPAAKVVPWRTPGAAQPPAPRAAKPAQPAVAPAARPARRRAAWERLLPLVFLLLFVLVVGGYLSGHLG